MCGLYIYQNVNICPKSSLSIFLFTEDKPKMVWLNANSDAKFPPAEEIIKPIIYGFCGFENFAQEILFWLADIYE